MAENQSLLPTPKATTLTTLPPELRLFVYKAYLDALLEDFATSLSSIAESRSTGNLTTSRVPAILTPAILEANHQLRDEAYPQYLASLAQVREMLRDQRGVIEDKMYRADYFDGKSGSSGMEIWARHMMLGTLCQKMERMEKRVGKWLEGGGSLV